MPWDPLGDAVLDGYPVILGALFVMLWARFLLRRWIAALQRKSLLQKPFRIHDPADDQRIDLR